MKLYSASPDPRDLAPLAARGLVDGVFLSTATMVAASAGRGPDEVIAAAARAARCPVLVPLASVHDEDLLLEARDRHRAADGVIVQVPFVEDCLRAMHQLARDGVPVVATLVVTPAQALLAARVGASGVVVDVELLEEHGLPPEATVRDLRATLDRHALPCDVIALHPRGASQFAACAQAGADAAVVEPAALRELCAHPLTDRGLDRLLGALSRRPRVVP